MAELPAGGAKPRSADAQMPQLPAGTPDFDGARARIAQQGPVSSEQVASALAHLDDDQRAYVRDAAQGARALQQSAGGGEGDIYFRGKIAAGMADGRAFRPDTQEHAAVVGAGSHQSALDALHASSEHPAEIDAKGYTEQELRRDWTGPVSGEDSQRGNRG